MQIQDPFRGRPILAAALAVAAGSWLGASGTVSVRAAAIASLGLATLAAAVPRRCASAALLAFLAAAAAVRAGAVAPKAAVLGAWRPSGASRDCMLGDVGGGTPRIALAKESVDPGDTILLLEGEPPRAFARGPAPGRAARSGSQNPPLERLPDEVVRLAAPESGPLDAAASVASGFRGRLLARVAKLADPLTRGLVGGLLFGDLSEIPDGVGDLFVRTGTFHVLAISGLQVVLVAVLLAGPLASILEAITRAASFGRWRPGRESLRALLLLLFVPVAGAGAPVTRSALAWIAGSLATRIPAGEPIPTAGPPPIEGPPRFLRRSGDPLALWGFALLVECLLHPEAPLSISVQLTYLATLGLVAGTRPILRAIRAVLPGRGRVAPSGATGRPRPDWARVPVQRALDAALGAVAASCAAVLATLPIVWSRFGEWCPAGVLATPAIALPVAWILVAGWTWVALPGLVPESALDVAGRWMIGILESVDRLPGTPDPLPQRPLVLLALACGGTFFALRGGPRSIARATAASWVLVLVPWTLAPSGLEVRALDVGNGTAVALREPGNRVLVFDAGSRDRPGVDREALAPLLAAWEAERVTVVLSHPDLDHDGALLALIERRPPEGWLGALPAELAARLPHETARSDAGQGRMLLAWPEAAGTELRLELARALAVEGNEGSRCLEVLWKEESLLFFGDAEGEGLAAWLRSRNTTRPARLLLFPHHGSDTEHIGALLAAVRPAEVWISASGEPEVCGELARRGVPTRLTSRDGPLSLDLP